MFCKILVIGASGSGTMTVGKMLAKELHVPHIETDDLFWLPVDPPFTKFRSKDELDEKLKTEVLIKNSWVLSGSPCGWGDVIVPYLNLAVFLIVPTPIRIERIIKREKQRFGSEILEGGKLYQSHQDFLAWTKRYDTGDINGRTKQLHENWLSNLSCPVLWFDGEINSDQLVEKILDYVKNQS